MKHASDMSAEECLERLKEASTEHKFSFRVLWDSPAPYGLSTGRWVVVLDHYYSKDYFGDYWSVLEALRDAVALLPSFVERVKARRAAEVAAGGRL